MKLYVHAAAIVFATLLLLSLLVVGGVATHTRSQSQENVLPDTPVTDLPNLGEHVVAHLVSLKPAAGDALLSPGDTFQFALSVQDPSASHPILAEFALPSGLQLTGMHCPTTPTQPVPCITTSSDPVILQCSPGPVFNPEGNIISEGGELYVEVSGRVDESAPLGLSTVVLDVRAQEVTLARASLDVRIVTVPPPRVDLDVNAVSGFEIASDRQDDQIKVLAGDTLTFEVAARNQGTRALRGVVLSIHVPPHCEITSIDTAFTCRHEGAALVHCSNVEVSGTGDDSASALTPLVRVVTSVATSAVDQGTFEVHLTHPQVEPVTFSGGVVFVPPLGTEKADLAVTVTPRLSAVPGLRFSFDVKVTNKGPDPAANVEISAQLPPALNFHIPSVPPSTLDVHRTNAEGPCAIKSDGRILMCSRNGLLREGDVAEWTIAAFAEPSLRSLEGEGGIVVSAASAVVDPVALNNEGIVSVLAAAASARLHTTSALNPDPVVPSRSRTTIVAITLANVGPSEATSVWTEITMPYGFRVYWTDPRCAYSIFTFANSAIRCEMDRLTVGESTEFIVRGNLGSVAVTQAADALVTTKASCKECNVTSEPFKVSIPQADLAVTADLPQELVAGNTHSLTFHLRNAGPDTALNSLLHIDLSGARLAERPTIVTNQDDASRRHCLITQDDVQQARIHCTWDDPLNMNEVNSITVLTKVAADATGRLSVVRQGASDVFDPSSVNNAEEATDIPITHHSVLSVRLNRMGQGPVLLGTEAVFHVDILNDGPSATWHDHTLHVTLPEGFEVLDAHSTVSGEGGACLVEPDRQTILCALGRGIADPRSSVDFEIRTVVDFHRATGNATVTASLEPDGAHQKLVLRVEEPPQPIADLSLDARTHQTHGEFGLVYAGEIATVDVVVHNNGPDNATDVVVRGSLAGHVADTSFYGVSINGVHDPHACPEVDDVGQLLCRVPRVLVSRESATLSLLFRVDPAARGAITSLFQVQSAENDPIPDNDASEELMVVGKPAVEATITALDTLLAGESLSWDLILHNAGLSSANTLEVVAQVPWATLADQSLQLHVQSSADTAQADCVLQEDHYVCHLPELPPAATVKLQVRVDRSPMITEATEVVLWAEATSTAAHQDPIHVTREKIVKMTPRHADLEMEYSLSAKSDAVAGESYKAKFLVHNNGPNEASEVSVLLTMYPDDDQLEGQVYFQVDDLEDSCASGALSSSWICHIPTTIGPDSLATVSFLVRIGSHREAPIHLRAEILGMREVDTHPDNDIATATVAIVHHAELTLETFLAPDMPTGGNEIVYTLVVTNTGPSRARRVSLEHNVTATTGDVHVHLPAIEGSVFACTLLSEQSIMCGADAGVDVDDPLALSLPVLLDRKAGPQLTASSVVRSEDDPTPNSPVVHEARIIAPVDHADVGVSVLHTSLSDDGTIVAGLPTVLVLGVRNAGPHPVRADVIVSLPEQLEFLEATGNHQRAVCHVAESAPRVVCLVEVLQSGDEEEITMSVHVDQRATHGPLVLSAIVSPLNGVVDANPANNERIVELHVVERTDLAVQVDATPVSIAGGERVHLMANVSAAGPSRARGNTLRWLLADALAYEGFHITPAGHTVCQEEGSETGILSCTLPDMNPAEFVSVVVDARAQYESYGEAVTQVSVTSETRDTDAMNDHTSLAVMVKAPRADMELHVTSDEKHVHAGSTVSYHYEMTNTGPQEARHVLFGIPGTSDTNHDFLSAVTFESATIQAVATETPHTCRYSSAGLLCIMGNIPKDETRAVDVVWRVKEDRRRKISVEAHVDSDTDDPFQANNVVHATTDVFANVDLVLYVSSTPEHEVTTGNTIRYTLSIENRGPDTASDVELLYDVPEGLVHRKTFMSSQPLLVAPDDTLGPSTASHAEVEPSALLASQCIRESAVLLRCSLGRLLSGAVTQVALIFQVPQFYNMSELVSSGEVRTTSDAETELNEADNRVNRGNPILVTQTEIQANLAVHVTSDSSDPVVAGHATTFHIAATSSPCPQCLPASNFVLVVPIPPDTQFVTSHVPNAPGLACAFDDIFQQLVCILSELSVNTTLDVDLELLTKPTLRGFLTVEATVSSDRPDADWSDNEASGRCFVEGHADLSVELFGDTTTVAGVPVSYTTRIHNAGPSLATHVEVVHNITGGTALLEDFASSGGNFPCDIMAPGLLRCTAPELGVGAVEEVTVTVGTQASHDTRDDVRVVVRTSSPEGSVESPAHVIDITPRQADLSLRMDPEDLGVAVAGGGEPILATFVVVNHGPQSAHNVVLHASLPSQVLAGEGVVDFSVVGNAMASGLGCEHTGRCTLGELVSQEKVEVRALVHFTGVARGPVKIGARVEADEADPDLLNNDASAQGVLRGVVDLSVILLDQPYNPSVAGERMRYVLGVRASPSQPSTATNVHATLVLPVGVTLLEAVPFSEDAVYTVVAGHVEFDVDEVPRGAEKVVELWVQVDPGVSGPLKARAHVTTALDEERNPEDNVVELETAVVNPVYEADLAVSLEITPDQHVLPGQQVAFLATILNHGPHTATHVDLVVELPEGVLWKRTEGTHEDDDCEALSNGHEIVCTFPRVDVGSAGIRRVSVHGEVTPASADTVIGRAEVGSRTERDPHPDNNMVEVTGPHVTRSTDLFVHVESDTDRIMAGSVLLFQVTVGNDGPSDASHVVLEDHLVGGYGTHIEASYPVTTLVELETSDVTPHCTIDPEGRSASCFMRSLRKDSTARFTFEVRTDAEVHNTTEAGTLFKNEAGVTSREHDSKAQNNRDYVVATILAPAPTPAPTPAVVSPVSSANETSNTTSGSRTPVPSPAPSPASADVECVPTCRNLQLEHTLKKELEFIDRVVESIKTRCDVPPVEEEEEEEEEIGDV